jgi:hypothetical protein
MAHYRKGIILATVVSMLIAFIPSAQADPPVTFELQEYFETLSIPYPEQSPTNLWTFHNKDHNEAFLPPSGGSYYDYYVTGSIMGGLIVSGDLGWANVPDAIPTFDGVFVHAGSPNPTVVVFRAPQPMGIYEIKLWSEMVGGGLSTSPPPPANGFDVTVNLVISGVTIKIGSFIFSGPPMVEAIYTPFIILQTGDMIEILYGNNGDYRFDHGNVNVFISGVPQPPFPVADTMSPTGAVHAYPNKIAPNKRLVTITLDGYVTDELSIARDGTGTGVSSAYLMVDGKKITLKDESIDLLTADGGYGRFSVTAQVQAKKGAVYTVELYASDTEPIEDGGHNSGLVDSTFIRVQ